MSHASSRRPNRAKPWIERLMPWIAALISAAVNLALLALLLYASKPTVTTPQGTAGGSRMKVDFTGDTDQPAQPTEPSKQPHKQPAKHAHHARSTNAVTVSKRTRQKPRYQEQAPDKHASVTPPIPVTQENDDWQSLPQTPAASTNRPVERHPETWTGRPPGSLDRDVADQDSGLVDNASASQGRRNDRMSGQPSLDVGGYMVYYDVRSETTLRAWKAQGMKELFIPLPGTDYYMVCPIQVAIDRGSGKCRLLTPDSPEMKAIGDGRQVINMLQVYRQGQPVWTGPGPYR